MDLIRNYGGGLSDCPNIVCNWYAPLQGERGHSGVSRRQILPPKNTNNYSLGSETSIILLDHRGTNVAVDYPIFLILIR